MTPKKILTDNTAKILIWTILQTIILLFLELLKTSENLEKLEIFFIWKIG